MGTIIHLPKALRSYVEPSKETVGALYSLIRGMGTDLYLIKSYGFEGDATLISEGRVADKATEDISKEENQECVIAKHILRGKLDKVAKDTLIAIDDKQINYFADCEGFTAITIASDFGLLAFGWQDGAKVAGFKSQLMVALLAYAFGYINSNSRDETMVKLLHSYLPFDGHMSIFSPTSLDLIICESLAGQSPQRNPPTGRRTVMVN